LGRGEALTIEPRIEETIPTRSETLMTLEKRMTEPLLTYATMNLPPKEPIIESKVANREIGITLNEGVN